MGDFVFNVAKGRTAELHNRVYTNDPANSALVLVALAAVGLESDAILKDYPTLADLLAAANNEPTNAGYARKVLTAVDPIDIDYSSDWVNATIQTQTWSAVGAGTAWAKLLVCYDDDTTSGSDANVIPMTAADFAVTPNGLGIVATVAGDGYYRAQ